MFHDEKRRLRREKKQIKHEGTKNARRELKRRLEENPDEAAFDEYDVGRARSEVLNERPKDEG